MADLAGYSYLIDHYQLPARPLARRALISGGVHGRRERTVGGDTVLEFQPSYRPDETLTAHLQFALRYEGLNLEVLAHLFSVTGAQEICAFSNEQPRSVAARRLGFIYEWLTGKELDTAASRKAAYVPMLDESEHFGLALDASARNDKYRVIDNLPGNRSFCPLVSKTKYLSEVANQDLRREARERLAMYPADLLKRAAAYLYLKETRSSFEVERERPSPDKAQRFVDLLRQAEIGQPLSEDRLIELQNAVVDPRYREASYRTRQNWIGDEFGYMKRVEFVPPRPEDVRSLMGGLTEFAERLRAYPDAIEPVIAASALSFGFVFIHPFMDGNGRLHRYLIHETLSNARFTPKGIVLPVSAVILSKLEEYQHALTSFSKPLNDRTFYNPDVPDVPPKGNDAVYFRYFDATAQASFLYSAIEHTVKRDLDEEIRYLIGFDRARTSLNAIADWPDHSLDLFINVVRQNGGKLSANKRKSHFPLLRDDEVERFERIVAESFDRADEGVGENTPLA